MRREVILESATRLIAASGYRAVSVEAFAAECGMTAAGMLHHFPSKEHLLTAVLERRDRLDAETPSVNLHQTPDRVAARATADAIVRRNLEQSEVVRMFTVLSVEALDPLHPAHEYFARRLQDGRSHVATHLFAWHSSPAQAALQLMMFLDGLQLNCARDPSIDALAVWTAFADLLFGPPIDVQ